MTDIKNYEEHFGKKIIGIRETPFKNVEVEFDDGESKCLFQNTTTEIKGWKDNITGEELYMFIDKLFQDYSKKIGELNNIIKSLNVNLNGMLKNQQALTNALLNLKLLTKEDLEGEVNELTKKELIEQNKRYKESILKSFTVALKVFVKKISIEGIEEDAERVLGLLVKDIKDSLIPNLSDMLESCFDTFKIKGSNLLFYLNDFQDMIRSMSNELDEEERKNLYGNVEEMITEFEKLDGYSVDETGLVIIPIESIKNIK